MAAVTPLDPSTVLVRAASPLSATWIRSWTVFWYCESDSRGSAVDAGVALASHRNDDTMVTPSPPLPAPPIDVGPCVGGPMVPTHAMAGVKAHAASMSLSAGTIEADRRWPEALRKENCMLINLS